MMNQVKQVLASDPTRELSELMQRSTLSCPQCGQRWLVAGVGDLDLHQCKSCGHNFSAKNGRLKRRSEKQYVRVSGE